MHWKHLLFPTLATVGALSLSAQTRDVSRIYAESCASCHGDKLQGASAPGFLDDEWLHGADDASIARVITDGVPDTDMVPWGPALTPAEVRSLVVYIREARNRSFFDKTGPAKPVIGGTATSQLHAFRIEKVAELGGTPWALAFLPDGRLLVSEKQGRLRLLSREGVLSREAVADTPETDDAGQGGYMEVALHPKHAENGWIYLAFTHRIKNPKGDNASMTKLVRGRIRDNAWRDEQAIYEAPTATYRRAGGVHFGCRIAFDDAGFLFFTIGERGAMQNAQDLGLPNGKVHRIHDDGRIPSDNPFAANPAALPTIWSYGHRNPQGLDFHPVTRELWETEHGPRGGDELNLVRPSLNYGWPIITYGINYNGTPITPLTAREGLEQPAHHWTPSIAVCGIDFYEGSLFQGWKNDLLVTGLASQELRRLTLRDGRLVGEELLLKGIGRLRDVASGPDGAVYLLVNDPDAIVRLVPAAL